METITLNPRNGDGLTRTRMRRREAGIRTTEIGTVYRYKQYPSAYENQRNEGPMWACILNQIVKRRTMCNDDLKILAGRV